MNNVEQLPMRLLPVSGRWCLHSYYTLCPYAPDGSGRILAAGTDLETGRGDVLILSAEGDVLDSFGNGCVEDGFYHTGFWQTWSPDARFVYYQRGTMKSPRIVKRELASGRESVINGDMEGAPPHGEPILSGLMGMLYAAGYASGEYRPNDAPVSFQKREDHGVFEFGFDPERTRLRLSVAEILGQHPDRQWIDDADHEIRQRLGTDEGLTLMAYCLRWSPTGERLLFYFGNHCVVKERGEPRVACIFTARKDLSDLRLALDLSSGPGVHWSWHPDGEHLIGYGPDPDDSSKLCIAQVRYDGSGYRRLSRHASGGHPSISPTDSRLLVTDQGDEQGGAVLFIDVRTDTTVATVNLPKFIGEREPFGRNPLRVCHHPVFHPDGDRVLCNTLPGTDAVLAEITVPTLEES